MHAWGVDPASGTVKWEFRSYYPADTGTGTEFPSGGRGLHGNGNGLPFHRMAVVSGQLYLSASRVTRMSLGSGPPVMKARAVDPADWNGTTVELPVAAAANNTTFSTNVFGLDSAGSTPAVVPSVVREGLSGRRIVVRLYDPAGRRLARFEATGAESVRCDAARILSQARGLGMKACIIQVDRIGPHTVRTTRQLVRIR